MAEAQETLIAEEEGERSDLNVSQGSKRTEPTELKRETLHPLVELTSMRVREFLREKEAVFWVFVFPVLLAFALGIAFRNTAPQELLIAVESGGAGVDSTRATEIASALSKSPEIEATVLSPEAAAQQLRTGKVALVVRA